MTRKRYKPEENRGLDRLARPHRVYIVPHSVLAAR